MRPLCKFPPSAPVTLAHRLSGPKPTALAVWVGLNTQCDPQSLTRAAAAAIAKKQNAATLFVELSLLNKTETLLKQWLIGSMHSTAISTAQTRFLSDPVHMSRISLYVMLPPPVHEAPTTFDVKAVRE